MKSFQALKIRRSSHKGDKMADKIIDGFTFTDAADAALVEAEIARIKYLAEKINMNNPQGVFAVYDKLVQGGLFVTPIGYEYLRTLQNYLYKCPDIPDETIRSIPVAISYTDALDKRAKQREEKLEQSARKYRKTFKNEYRISLVANLILIILVIAMFVITLQADNPNMLNYREAILNEYSEWEQDLSGREKVIKERENELGIEHVPINAAIENEEDSYGDD